VVVRVSLALIQAVTIETCEAVCKWLAWVVNDVLCIRGRIVEENLRLAFPDKSAGERQIIARRMWEYLLLMICETAQLRRKFHETNWRRYVEAPRKREWIHAASRPGAKLCVTAHFGNFEALGHVSNFWGFRMYAIARNLDNPYLDRFINDYRAS